MPHVDQQLAKLLQKGGNDAHLMLLDMIQDLQGQVERFEGKVASVPQNVTIHGAALSGVNMTVVGQIVDKILKDIKGEKGDTPTRQDLIRLIIPLIPAAIPGQDGKDGADVNQADVVKEVLGKIPKADDGKDADEEKIIDQIEKDLPKLGTAMRDALELLQGEERLDQSAIKGLKELMKDVSKTKQAFMVGGSAVNTVQFTDLSSKLDGSTKIFTVPRRRYIALFGTQFPIIYRPTTDYTGDGTAQLTLTSEVSAPEAGQSLILLHSRV
jgi:hypothetical protein